MQLPASSWNKFIIRPSSPFSELMQNLLTLGDIIGKDIPLWIEKFSQRHLALFEKLLKLMKFASLKFNETDTRNRKQIWKCHY